MSLCQLCVIPVSAYVGSMSAPYQCISALCQSMSALCQPISALCQPYVSSMSDLYQLYVSLYQPMSALCFQTPGLRSGPIWEWEVELGKSGGEKESFEKSAQSMQSVKYQARRESSQCWVAIQEHLDCLLLFIPIAQRPLRFNNMSIECLAEIS